jgi:phosphatidylglycerophosphatase A
MTAPTLGRFHPARLIATVFGVGYAPFAPGTWGSLAALPAAWLIASVAGRWALVPAAILLFFVGWWATTQVVRESKVSDPQSVVIDEVVGQWLTLAVAPLHPVAYGLGFVLFRAADIVKPWPARWADRKLKNGFGVMLDDVFAALYSAALLWGAVRLLGMPA